LLGVRRAPCCGIRGPLSWRRGTPRRRGCPITIPIQPLFFSCSRPRLLQRCLLLGVGARVLLVLLLRRCQCLGRVLRRKNDEKRNETRAKMSLSLKTDGYGDSKQTRTCLGITHQRSTEVKVGDSENKHSVEVVVEYKVVLEVHHRVHVQVVGLAVHDVAVLRVQRKD